MAQCEKTLETWMLLFWWNLLTFECRSARFAHDRWNKRHTHRSENEDVHAVGSQQRGDHVTRMELLWKHKQFERGFKRQKKHFHGDWELLKVLKNFDEFYIETHKMMLESGFILQIKSYLTSKELSYTFTHWIFFLFIYLQLLFFIVLFQAHRSPQTEGSALPPII